MFQVLADHGINVRMIATSPIKVSCVDRPRRAVAEAVAALHEAFQAELQIAADGSASVSSLRVAVVGATGAVGPVVLEVLAERGFPASEVVAFASARSAGTRVAFAGGELEVRELTADAFEGFDLALFSAGGGTSRTFAPEAVARGCVVVDKSSAFRMDPAVPLVVPEVNPEAAAAHRGIVSNPNCSTIQLVAALKPLHDAAGLAHVTVATYQAVSAAPAPRRWRSCASSRRRCWTARRAEPSVYPHQIAFNVLPQCDAFDGDAHDGGDEARPRDAQDPRRPDDRDQRDLRARAGMARPLRGGLDRDARAARRGPRARAAVPRRPACASSTTRPPAPTRCRSAAAGTDDVLVGPHPRRRSPPNGLSLLVVVADNLRKGAATNGVQIAELLVERGLVRVPDRAAA